MKTRLAALAGLLFGLALGATFPAQATSTPPAKGSVANYVNPAFSPPKAPYSCGEDGGAGCVLSFDAGACIRIATMGTWKYQVGSFDLFPDGGTVVNLATCALYTLPDGGAATYSDGGTVYPDGGGGPALGGVISYPRLTPLTDDKVEGWCFYGNQSQLSACTVDGGILSVSERYP
jgi:hypothetical protein